VRNFAEHNWGISLSLVKVDIRYGVCELAGTTKSVDSAGHLAASGVNSILWHSDGQERSELALRVAYRRFSTRLSCLTWFMWLTS
jgi:hypothetical protein